MPSTNNTVLKSHLEQLIRFYLSVHGDRREDGHNWTYTGAEDFVMDRGLQFSPQKLDPEERRILLAAADRCRVGRFERRQCFYNAQLLVLGDLSGKLEYIEGYAIGASSMPVHHGWAAINNKVIDLTWRTQGPNHKGRLRDRIFGKFPEGWEYLGAEIDRETILRRLNETRSVGTLILNWEQGYPLLKWERLRPFSYKKLKGLEDYKEVSLV